jgi:hypothetical protein
VSEKLQRVVHRLNGSKQEMCLTLEGDDLQISKWGVEASFAAHEDM